MDTFNDLLKRAERMKIMAINLQEFRERKAQAKEQAVYNEIQDEMNGLWSVIEQVSALPYNLQVRLVSYCLQHLISFDDLSKKLE